MLKMLTGRAGNDTKDIIFSEKPNLICVNTGLFKMTVGVVTTCHTQYTSDSSIRIFSLIEQHCKISLHTLQVLYMCTICDSTDINTIIVFVPKCL